MMDPPAMNKRNQLLRYLLINVAVSALTALAVLFVWARMTAPAASDSLFNEDPPSTEAAEVDSSAQPVDFSGQLQISAIIGAGDLQSERLTIEHVGDADVSLAGWRLEDADGNRYRFPGLVLHSGGEVTLFTRQGEDTVTELHWGRTDPVWSEGEEARLIDPDGETQATYVVP